MLGPMVYKHYTPTGLTDRFTSSIAPCNFLRNLLGLLFAELT